jgi:hypothetical protein
VVCVGFGFGGAEYTASARESARLALFLTLMGNGVVPCWEASVHSSLPGHDGVVWVCLGRTATGLDSVHETSFSLVR